MQYPTNRSEEIMPMHLHEGKSAIKNLLRGYDAMYALATCDGLEIEV